MRTASATLFAGALALAGCGAPSASQPPPAAAASASSAPDDCASDPLAETGALLGEPVEDESWDRYVERLERCVEQLGERTPIALGSLSARLSRTTRSLYGDPARAEEARRELRRVHSELSRALSRGAPPEWAVSLPRCTPDDEGCVEVWPGAWVRGGDEGWCRTDLDCPDPFRCEPAETDGFAQCVRVGCWDCGP